MPNKSTISRHQPPQFENKQAWCLFCVFFSFLFHAKELPVLLCSRCLNGQTHVYGPEKKQGRGRSTTPEQDMLLVEALHTLRPEYHYFGEELSAKAIMIEAGLENDMSVDTVRRRLKEFKIHALRFVHKPEQSPPQTPAGAREEGTTGPLGYPEGPFRLGDQKPEVGPGPTQLGRPVGTPVSSHWPLHLVCALLQQSRAVLPC